MAVFRNIETALRAIDQRDVLRRGDDHRALERHTLGDGELGVAGARRHVQHQHIQRRPGHVPQHLGQGALHHRPAPDHGFVLPLTRKPMDMALMPYFSMGMSFLPSVLGFSRISSRRGTLGP